MKLNQATAAAAAIVSATFASSSSAQMLSSNHSYPHRMQQELTDSDQCMSDFEAPFQLPTLDNAIEQCASAQTKTTAVKRGDNVTITVDINYSACDSFFTEACTADKGTIVAFFDVGVDCTFMGQSLKIITKGTPLCIPPSCVSYWESVGKDEFLTNSDELVKEIRDMFSKVFAEEGIESGDGECKMNSFSIVDSSVNAGERSVIGSSSAGEPTGAGTAERSLVVGSSAGKASGMIALAATSAAAALFFF